MRKSAFLALILVLVLTLSSCSIIVKDQAVDDSTPIITLGDTVINKKDFNERVNTYLSEQAYFYSMYGYNLDVTDPQIITDAQNGVVSEFEESTLRNVKLQEWNLAELTEEDNAKIAAHLEEEMTGYRDEIKNYYITDKTLEGEALEAEIDRQLEAFGINEDVIRPQVENEILQEKFRAEVVKDAAVTEEEITAKFNELVESNKTTYEGKAGSWASAFNNGSTLYYTPEGVRMVKQILVKYTDEDQAVLDQINNDLIGGAFNDYYAAMSSLSYLGITDYTDAVNAITVTVTPSEEVTGEYYTGAVTTEYNADALDPAIPEEQKELYIQMAVSQAVQDFYTDELNKARAVARTHIDAEADDILAQLEAGADWDTLMAEKTQDPGMQGDAPTAVTGYAVAADMTGFDTAFVDGAMAIANVGEVSGKIAGEQYGYYIIKYVADAVAGTAELDQAASDSIRETVLTDKQNTLYSETIAQWISEAGFKVDLNALK